MAKKVLDKPLILRLNEKDAKKMKSISGNFRGVINRWISDYIENKLESYLKNDIEVTEDQLDYSRKIRVNSDDYNHFENKAHQEGYDPEGLIRSWMKSYNFYKQTGKLYTTDIPENELHKRLSIIRDHLLKLNKESNLEPFNYFVKWLEITGLWKVELSHFAKFLDTSDEEKIYEKIVSYYLNGGSKRSEQLINSMEFKYRIGIYADDFVRLKEEYLEFCEKLCEKN